MGLLTDIGRPARRLTLAGILAVCVVLQQLLLPLHLACFEHTLPGDFDGCVSEELAHCHGAEEQRGADHHHGSDHHHGGGDPTEDGEDGHAPHPITDHAEDPGRLSQERSEVHVCALALLGSAREGDILLSGRPAAPTRARRDPRPPPDPYTGPVRAPPVSL